MRSSLHQNKVTVTKLQKWLAAYHAIGTMYCYDAPVYDKLHC